jgi:hypothetical protein
MVPSDGIVPQIQYDIGQIAIWVSRHRPYIRRENGRYLSIKTFGEQVA